MYEKGLRCCRGDLGTVFTETTLKLVVFRAPIQTAKYDGEVNLSTDGIRTLEKKKTPLIECIYLNVHR